MHDIKPGSPIKKAKISKIGNSLALRIPQNVAKELYLHDKSEVELYISEENEMVVVPRKKKSFQLTELLSGITKDNLHHETETGPALGAEVIDD